MISQQDQTLPTDVRARVACQWRGASLTLAQTWSLAQAGYRARLSPTYVGRSPQQAQQLFVAPGLLGPFWQLP